MRFPFGGGFAGPETGVRCTERLFAADREAVAMGLSKAIERDPRAADAAMTLRFLTSLSASRYARSELDAHKVASEILPTAGAALDAHADPGADFDGPSMSVTPAGAPILHFGA